MNEQDKIITNEKLGRVYLITSPSGRKYVGSTEREIGERWGNYRTEACKTQVRIYNSIKKYGWDAHNKEVIWEGPVEYMYKMEHLLGLEHNVLDLKLGLNCRLPGYDDIPSVCSEETKEKIRKARKNQPPPSKETRDKISKSNSTRIVSDKVLLAFKYSRENRIISEETRSKMAKSASNRICTEETRKKLSKSLTGKNTKPFICNETGELFTKLLEATKLGMSISKINVLLKNGKSYKGYSFKYINKEIQEEVTEK